MAKLLTAISQFLKLEAAGGILLALAACAAMVIANSPWEDAYRQFLDMRGTVQIGAVGLSKPLLLWINDGLMAVFFLLVGLELKREMLEGELSNRSQIVLPALGALGGMVIPAAVYIAVVRAEPELLSGWGIPTATDIAFALGVLSLLGNRVPGALKVFLLTLAILDDLGAIVIIAVFYSDQISLTSLWFAAAAIGALFLLNVSGVKKVAAYLLVGIVLWVSVLKSGIHATLAGVAIAAFIPIGGEGDTESSPLKQLEHDLHSSVAYAILPLFAFANSGVTLGAGALSSLFQPVPMAIAAGLLLGKPIGVAGACWVAIKAKWAGLPQGIRWGDLWGVSFLCGIGFTMSLFINALAFDSTAVAHGGDGRIGIIAGSVLATVAGYLVLRRSLRARSK
ncbi:MAG TPA: Na+/H+ antiporter NhaA [Burkholderiales bacterium]|nr:Na+/H+ antiporter NhaA [Burkholderiales bacterium]